MSEQAKALETIISQVNALKLDYNTTISRIEKVNQSVALFRLVDACLRLYHASSLAELGLPQSEQGPADEAAILAAIALIKLYHLGHKGAILRSLVVLEHLLMGSKHNYEALLLSTQICMYLGLGSLAISRYARLSIKNIQQASMSWILFPRISRIHPWSVEVSTDGPLATTFDPLKEVERALKWHQVVGITTYKGLERMMSNKQYSTMIKLLETQEMLQSGASRLILEREYQNIKVMRRSSDKGPTTIAKVPRRVHDDRERLAFPNYEIINQPDSAEYIPNVLPHLRSSNSSWLIHETAPTNIYNNTTSDAGRQRLTDQPEGLQDGLPVDFCRGITPVEARVSSILKHLEKAIMPSVDILDSDEKTLAHLDQLNQQLLDFLKDCQSLIPSKGSAFGDLDFSPGQHIPLWFAFHGYLTIVSMCYSVVGALRRISKDRSFRAELQQRLLDRKTSITESCERLLEILNTRALDQRRVTRSPEFEQFLKDEICGDEENILGGVIEEIVGADSVNSVCAMICESYGDAFDGVLKSSSSLWD